MNKEVTIPTSLHEITLDQYIKFVKIDEEDTDNVVYDSMEAIFGFSREVVDLMTQKSVEGLAVKINEMVNQEYLPLYKFPIKGVYYGMIPDFTEEIVKFKEFTDASMHIDGVLNKELNPDSYKRFMAVLFRPIVKEENGLIELEAYNGTQEHYDKMGNIPASVFKGAESFFLTLREDLLKCSQTYIEKGEGLEIQALVKHLEQNGAGTEVQETLLKLVGKH